MNLTTNPEKRYSIGRRDIVAGAVGLLAAGRAGASHAAVASATPALRRGVSVDSLLNRPEVAQQNPFEYKWPPFSTPQYQLPEGTFSALRRVGFDFVRLTVDPAIFMANPGARRQQLIALLLDRVRRFIDHGLAVVVDLHPIRVNPAYPVEGYTSPISPFISSFMEVTATIARALGTLPPAMVALELLNEPIPQGAPRPELWQARLEQLHGAARSQAKYLTLVLSGFWGAFGELPHIDPSAFNGSNVIYTFHYYEPLVFTHQGASWVDTLAYVNGLTWPPDPSNVRDVEARAVMAAARKAGGAAPTRIVDSLHQQLSTYAAVRDGPGQVANHFARVRTWADRNGVPPQRVLLGEFSARRDLAETPEVKRSRMAWLATVRRTAEANGFPWAYWGLSGDATGGFGLVAPGSMTTFDPEMLAALGLSASG